MVASLRINRLKAKRYRRHVSNPLPAIQALLDSLDAIVPSKRLPADVLSQLRETIRHSRKWAEHARRLNGRRDNLVNSIKTQRAMGLRLARTRDLNETLSWLLNRQAHASKGLYAMAMGKRTAAKLGRDHYKAIGRKGAQSRWNPEIAQYLAMWSVGTVFPD